MREFLSELKDMFTEVLNLCDTDKLIVRIGYKIIVLGLTTLVIIGVSALTYNLITNPQSVRNASWGM